MSERRRAAQQFGAGTLNLTITPYGADDEDAIDASYRIQAAARAADVPDMPPPCRFQHAAAHRHPMPGGDVMRYLARLDGEPVGVVVLQFPTLDNLENAWVELVVHPRYRRRGIGRALYARTVDLVRAAGRKRLMGNTIEQLPDGPERDGAGSKFAEMLGMQRANVEVRRKLDVSRAETRAVDRLLADAWQRAEGYSLVQWRNRVPEEYLDDVAYLDSRLTTDAPIGELKIEAEKMDADRVRRRDDAALARGNRTYGTGVRHDGSGRLIALSALGFEKTIPEHAWQWITLVDPDHRGHRLGTIVKIENLRYAREHESVLRSIDTWNAASNGYMISINEAIGFRPVDAWPEWQIEV
jgi:GNAT superfamily N-acetyltransferase